MESLPARVECVVREHAWRLALIDGERRLTYGEFWSRAQGFAAHLRACGVAPGDRVALILPNRLEAAVAWYGAWLAGGVVVPMNAQARVRDFLPWLQHAHARHVVYETAHADAREAVAQWQPEAGATALEDQGTLPASEPIEAIDAGELRAATLAVILYTSGTTGAPKGVMLSHGNLLANAQSIVRYLALTAEDRVLSVLPFYYAYGASVLHTHLMVGGCVVLGPGLMFPLAVLDAIEEHRATGFPGVPSTFALLMDHLATRASRMQSLRYLTQAGGAMAPALTQRLREVLPHPRLFVMYGQTEATSRISWLPPERLHEKLGSVGIPIDGVQWCVRRDDGSEADTGESGEVCVRGANVMLGYWNNEEATRIALREGWLHTGDLGHLDADGYLFLQGRRSDMIKTGAHRVHPTDVEEVIAEIPGVREVAVVGVDDEIMGQVIQAFVVATERPPRAEDRIKAHCRARLAPYKIPRHITFVDALPRTSSGKVRRVQLMEQIATS